VRATIRGERLEMVRRQRSRRRALEIELLRREFPTSNAATTAAEATSKNRFEERALLNRRGRDICPELADRPATCGMVRAMIPGRASSASDRHVTRGGLITQFAVLLEQLGNHFFQLGGELGIQSRNFRRIRLRIASKITPCCFRKASPRWPFVTARRRMRKQVGTASTSSARTCSGTCRPPSHGGT